MRKLLRITIMIVSFLAMIFNIYLMGVLLMTDKLAYLAISTQQNLLVSALFMFFIWGFIGIVLSKTLMEH